MPNLSQSRQKMMKLLPSKKTKNMSDALLSGFEAGSYTLTTLSTQTACKRNTGSR